MAASRDLLLLSHRAPVPPLTGSQVKPFHIARVLAARGWRVHLRCFGDAAERARVAGTWLERGPASLGIVGHARAAAALAGLAGLPRGRSLTDCWFDQPAMHRSVRDAVARHGIRRAVGYSSAMSQFVPAALRARSYVELADLDSAKFEAYVPRHRWPMSAVYALEAGRLARREREIVETFGGASLVSARERELLRARWPASLVERVDVMTNGVDVGHFSPAAAAAALAAVADPRERATLVPGPGPYLVFTGVMDYPPNVEAVRGFADDVFPAVRARWPEARFAIVGKDPSPEVAALAGRPGIHVTGLVADVRPYLARADLAVIPLSLARGIQNKALEAMACGTAVACTTATHEGIGARPGVDYRIADTPSEWLDAIGCAMHDRAALDALRTEGRRFVEAHHSWEAVLAPLIGFLERDGANAAARVAPSVPEAVLP